MFSRIRTLLDRLPRRWKSLMLVAFDAVALFLVLWLSLELRVGPITPTVGQWALMAMAPIVAIPIFVRLGLYRAVIRYLPERALWTIVSAMGLSTIAWVFVLFLIEATRFATVPRTIVAFYFVLGTIVIAGSRFAAKFVLQMPERGRPGSRQVMIYGAGDSGRQLATALAGEGRGFVGGFLDDDPNLHGRDVSGLRVYPPSELKSLIKDFGIREVILSMPSLERGRRQEIYTRLSRMPVRIRTLPSLREIASGKHRLDALRDIDIDDLLGRSSVPANPELLERMIAGRVVLVSGGGGSIGSELCRIIAALGPRTLVILEASELALYQIERSLRREARVVPVLGSVVDELLVRQTLAEHRVEVVFHAAAHKHVPLVEANAIEGIRNNVIGTYTMAHEAYRAGVADFVLISTDKAVRPASVMGATKRWAELIVQHFGVKAGAAPNRQRFSAVRFGNVLGSNGSVVPLFREQIAAGGPVTLTDPRMTRYFMSIHEAAELIVQAGALSSGDDIFLLEMGEPIRIADLAENMVRLAGLSVRTEERPDGDIEIAITGIRPGEKLTEELFYDPSLATQTRQPKILRAAMGGKPESDFSSALEQLRAALDLRDEAAARKILFGHIEG